MSATRRTLSSIPTNPWKIGVDYKNLIGWGAVIVSKGDEHSKHLAQKMWHNLQTQGIQSTFITMRTLYPVVNEVKDAAQLFQRSGSKSIITIGDGSVTDFGKILRKILESNISSDKLFETYNSVKQHRSIPHFSVMHTPSAVHFLPNAMMVHKEEDLLVGVPCEVPTVSILDENPHFPKPYLSLNTHKLNFISYLFDYYFAYFYLNQKHALPILAERVLSERPKIELSSLTSLHDLARVSQQFANHRINFMKNANIRSDLWPGLIELASNLTATDEDFPFTFPFSYHQLIALHSIFSDDFAADDLLSDHDQTYVLPAMKEALNAVLQTVQSTVNELSNLHELALQDIYSLKDKSRFEFRKPYFKPSSSPMMAEGNIQKIVILLDDEEERAGSLTFAGQQKKLLLDSDILPKLHDKIRNEEVWKKILTRSI